MPEVAQVNTRTTLSIIEATRLHDLEAVVERGLKTFVEVGSALMEIRDGRLYRELYGTFEEYCRERWGMSRPRAYQLIDAAAVAANLSTMVDKPTSERQARPLATLDPDLQRAAWRRAVESAPNGKVTGAHVERAVRELESREVSPGGMEVSQQTSSKERLQVHFSSDRGDWETPQDLFDELHAEFSFDVDVCANEQNYKRPYYSKEDDALQLDWNTQTCWMNPPYGRAIGEWVKKAYESARAGATVVCLVPARTDTRWWWDYVIHGEVRFLKGRLRFVGAENGAPFPSAVVVFRPGVLAPDGKVVWWEREGGDLDDA